MRPDTRSLSSRWQRAGAVRILQPEGEGNHDQGGVGEFSKSTSYTPDGKTKKARGVIFRIQSSMRMLYSSSHLGWLLWKRITCFLSHVLRDSEPRRICSLIHRSIHPFKSRCKRRPNFKSQTNFFNVLNFTDLDFFSSTNVVIVIIKKLI